MKRVFVAFATSDFFPLLEVAVKSVGEFSQYPIVVYGINSDVVFSTNYAHVLKRRIDVKYNGKEIYYQKFNIIIHTLLKEDFDELVYVESDDIVNYNIDELFDRCRLITKYPICPIHPDDVKNQQGLMNTLGVTKRTQHYVHAHMIVNRNCLPFLQECYKIALSLKHHALNWDESLLNVMFWKYGLKDYYTDVFDPYFGAYKIFLGKEDGTLEMHGYGGKKVSFHMIHGCKDVPFANDLLQQLVEYRKSKNGN